MAKYIDLTGKRFNYLTVIERYGHDSQGSVTWKCQCDCGNKTITTSRNLKSGHTKSCGCYGIKVSRESKITHNMTETRLYQIWLNMKRRCDNKKVQSYKLYGERGIEVCKEWRESFESFAEWSFQNGYDENKPAKECSIDRIDNDKGYEPSNCRWVSQKAQARNKRNNHVIEYKGEKRILKEWAEVLGMNYGTLVARINTHKWSIERAFETPVGQDKWHKYLNK